MFVLDLLGFFVDSSVLEMCEKLLIQVNAGTLRWSVLYLLDHTSSEGISLWITDGDWSDCSWAGWLFFCGILGWGAQRKRMFASVLRNGI